MRKQMKKIIIGLLFFSLILGDSCWMLPVNAQEVTQEIKEEDSKESEDNQETEPGKLGEEETSDSEKGTGETEETEDTENTETTENTEEGTEEAPEETEKTEETAQPEGREAEEPIEALAAELSEAEGVFASMTEANIASGWYTLNVFSNNRLAMDIKSGSDGNGAAVQIWNNNDSLAQRFYISRKENGWYTIRNISSGKFLTLAETNVKNGAKLSQWSENGSASQEFKFYQLKNGALVIRPNGGKNLVCDITAGVLQNGSKLQAFEYNGTISQHFKLRGWKIPGTEEQIANGVYRVYPAAASGLSLDVSNGSFDKGANVQVFAKNGTPAQEWKIVKQGDWYRLINVRSSKVLDTKGGSRKSGANIQQYTANAGKGQLFKFYKTGKNSYCIMSKLGTVLDCAGGSFRSGTNVWAYEVNKSSAQQWGLQKLIVSSATERSVKTGYYNIFPGSNNGLQMTVAGKSGAAGANIQVSAKVNDGAQSFCMEKQSDGWYMLKNVNSGKYLDVANGNPGAGINLQQYQKNSSNAQKFKLYDAGNGQYYIQSKLGTFVEADVRNGGNIYMNRISGQPLQKWRLQSVTPERAAVNIANGNYNLFSALGGNKVIDIANGSKASGGNVQIFDWNGTAAQNFYIHRESDGWYTIKNNNSQLYLDVRNGKAAAGANLWQYKGNGSDAQKFKFYDVGNGKVFIKSKLGTVIDVANGQRANGANVQLYSYNATNAQLWTVKKPSNGWRYKDGYKLYYNANGQLVKDVSSIIGKRSAYEIKVNKQKNVVTVYAKDGNNGYIIPVKSFVCSVGGATPLGTFHTPAKYRWWTLMGPSWGQWCTRITGSILFHSVYYLSPNNNMTLSVEEYNKLGTTASHGCVRLTARDAKWIYGNCGLGTKVTIYNSSNAGPFGKPSAAKLPSWHTWDPTDPGAKYKCQANGCH